MAQKFGEVWLTCATHDDSVINVLVLVESLRRTRTTRKIGVIVSENVSSKFRNVLRKTFDAVFLMDKDIVPEKGFSEEERAKAYSFSLKLFEKCIFLSPESIFLENADALFDGNKHFKVMKGKREGTFDTSVVLFSPSLNLFEFMGENETPNGTSTFEKMLKKALGKEYGINHFSYIPGNSVLKMSVDKAKLLRERTHAPIIQFVDFPYKTGKGLVDEFSTLKRESLGLPEKLIVDKWMELYKNADKIIRDPRLAPNDSAKDFGEVYTTEPIAVIGMSCRYPGANNLQEFWNMLYKGDEAIREPPAFRWTKEHSLRVSQQERKTTAGFLSSTVDEFDARFFGVSPKEAQYMDPQARLLHEVLWEALEDSGIDPTSLKGSNGGVFMGSWMNDYKDIVQGSADKDFFRTYMGNSIGATAARLSFLLGLTGPSIATESGCSSAIVALDLAIKSLRNGETNLAMAGGVNLLLHPFTSNIMDYVIAPDGRCKTFDERANGFGRAEGCGVLVLKRLTDALRDGDNIWAMVRGSAVSQEGISKSLGTPTVHCEALAMEQALKDAGVLPEAVSFVETHGTGTSVGDPMEISAIRKAYYSSKRKSPLVIGSVKTNVGHTESCSGITGIMKTILAMQHELIPKHKSLNDGFKLNPDIDLNSIPALIPMDPVPWPKLQGQPRIAGVSSFGITGTDGHVIIQEAPDYELPKFYIGLERPLHIMKISGKSPEALEELLESYQTHLHNKNENKETDFADVTYTANIGRASFNNRAFIIGKDYEDALKAIQGNKVLRGDATGTTPLTFLFTGQGSQYSGMAKTLYETSPIFRINFDSCARILQEKYNVSLRPILWDASCTNELNRTLYSQTSIFVVEYCLLKLWESFGIIPDAVVGHSLGEFAAAVAAGALKLEDALMLVAERSRLIDNLPRGKMLVIKADKATVDKTILEYKKIYSDFWADFAALNTPEQTVIAGGSKMIEDFANFCESKSIKSIILAATHAFHSRHMDPMLKEYRKIASRIQPPEINDNAPKYISGLEGKVIDLKFINADYWVRHTREKVSFIEACQALQNTESRNFVEVGPQPVLSSFVMMNCDNVRMNCFPSLRRGADEWEILLTTLGKLYLYGYNIDWKGFDETYKRRKVSVPFHPFHRKSFWVDPSGSNVTLIHPLVGHSIANASNINFFQNDISAKNVPYLKDHCIGNKIVFPGAGYTEMCLSAGYCVANGLTEQLEKPKRAMRLENVRIDSPLELKEGKRCRMQVVVDLPESSSETNQVGFRVKVFHHNTMDSDGSNGKWVLHASANFLPAPSTHEALTFWRPNEIMEVVKQGDELSVESFYKAVDEVGLKFGPTFRSISRHWNLKDGNENIDKVVAEVPLPEDSAKYLLHPLVLDAAIQSGILTRSRYETSKLKVPVSFGRLTLFPTMTGSRKEADGDGKSPEEVVWVYAWKENDKFYQLITTPTCMAPIALIEDVELVDTNVRTIESVLEQQTNKYPDSWEETWRAIPGPLNNRAELLNLPCIFGNERFHADLDAAGQSSLEDIEIQEKTFRMLYLYILKAFYELGWDPEPDEIIDVRSFCTKFGIAEQFLPLIKFYFKSLQDEDRIVIAVEGAERNQWRVLNLPPPLDEVNKESVELYNFLIQSRASKVTNIYSRISSSLVAILKGEESALEMLFPTEENEQQYSVDTYYQNYPGRPHIHNKMVVIVQTLLTQLREANKSNNDGFLRVLEVGSGTGSMSKHVLDWLHDIWGEKFEYYYTDISQSFFAKAEKKYEGSKNQLKFCVFNLEQNPLDQVPLNYFDLVFGTDVLHATRNLRETLVNIRQTMRPRGALCFTETVVEALDLTFVFGLLEGYWRFEDYDIRPHHSCCSMEHWEKVIKESGFSDIEATTVFLDAVGCITAEAAESTDISSLIANPEILQLENKRRWMIFTPGKSAVLEQVANILYSCGHGVELVMRASDRYTPSSIQEGIVIKEVVAADAEDGTEIKSLLTNENVHGIIYAWGSDTEETEQIRVSLPFMHIAKHIVGASKPPRLYVVTQGIQPITEALIPNPTSATLYGMAKSLKNENSDLFVRCVDLDNEDTQDNLVNQILFELANSKNNRLQVAYRDGQRYEPRFTKASMPTAQDLLQLPQGTDRYHLVLPKSRIISDLEFDALEDQPVAENEIEVKVKAYALNFKDVLTILKPSAEFEKLNTVGLDYAGIVSKVGKSVNSIKIGDRVFGCNFKEAQLPSHLVVTPESVVNIPDGMTFWEAATLPAVFATSYYCLMTVAKMKKGETVLIHTGSGGVGLSAIQLAKHVGAEIITTAGSPRKRAYLRSLGIKHVFNSRNSSYEQEILKVTNGRGVDIVLNSITGPGLKEASLNSCAKNARFVEMSKLSIWTEEEVYARRPDVQYSIVDLTYLDHSVWKNLLEQMKQFLLSGNVKAIPFVKFDALNIRQALQYFQKAKHIGKIVCTMPEVNKKEGQFQVDVHLFNEDSTYLVTGGLGGIGFEVAKWMIERGAKNVVLVGRNPPKPDVQKEIDEINEKGFNLIPKYADVGNYSQIKDIIQWIKENGKPLRGVMHLAGVLVDNLYANQTWESFNATFTPKVTGTWHLHELTRDAPLEHFVFYSSITALFGTPAQPNHAGANCFEDAFAHYRHSLGLPATSINWGQWGQIGCAKEITMSGILPVSMARMMNGLEGIMRLQRIRGCFMDFENFETWSFLCPMFKTYLDERLWKQSNRNSGNGEAINGDQFWQEIDALEEKDAKMTVTSTYLKRILRQALRLEADETINDDADIQDLGVDSLMLIELKNSIQTLLGSRVNVSASLLKNCQTVRQLANAIVGKIMGENEVQMEKIKLSPEEFNDLLEQDCQLPEHIVPTGYQPDATTKASNFRKILVTGCTGQLGPYIISELCEQYKSLEKIVCLIRAKEGASPSDKLSNILKSMDLTDKVQMEKLECIAGDVAQINFGLAESDYLSLCQTVDAVIHCAVKANHVEAYRKYGEDTEAGGVKGDIRSVNVGGTLNVLKFAAEAKTKHVYYASAYTNIFGGNEKGTLSDDWPELDQIQIIVNNSLPGYQTSKFVCEHLLKQANLRGIPCKVFRFPWITGDSKTGQLNYAQNHYILRFMSYLKLKAIPSLVAPAVVMPVDTCAKLSLKLFMSDETPFEIYNVGHPDPQLEQEFVQVAKEEYGIEMEIVEFQEFVDKLKNDESPLESFRELYEDVERAITLFTSDAVQSVKGYLDSPENFFKNDKLKRWIPDFDSGIESSMSIIKKDLNYVKSKGFFEKFGI